MSPNTLDMLHRMQPGLPGDRPTGKTFGKRVRALSSAVRHGIKFSPYISSKKIDEIRRRTERLDLVCNAKLARFSKRRQD